MITFIFNNVTTIEGTISGSLYALDPSKYVELANSKVFECRIDGTVIDYIPNAKINKKREDDTFVYFTVTSEEKPVEQISEFSVSSSSVEQAVKFMATSFTDEQALQVPDLYDAFEIGRAYKKDDRFTYNDVLFKVNQDHTSQEQWIPGETGTESLYTKITLNGSGYPIWQQPTGAHDAYNRDDVVEFKGVLYKSLIDGNVYSPETYPAGWEKYTEE